MKGMQAHAQLLLRSIIIKLHESDGAVHIFLKGSQFLSQSDLRGANDKFPR